MKAAGFAIYQISFQINLQTQVKKLAADHGLKALFPANPVILISQE